MIAEEEWRPIFEYEGVYEVSSLGRVKRVAGCNSSKSGSIRKSHVGNNGYVVMNLSKNGSVKGFSEHRLVTRAFLGPCPDGMQVNHKNGIRHDNRLENLEYLTPSDNARHSFRVLGRKPTRLLGKKNGRSKLSMSQVTEIRKKALEGISYKELAKEFGVAYVTVSHIVIGRIRNDGSIPKYIPKSTRLKNQVLALRKKGHTHQEISDIVDTPRPTISYWLRKWKAN